MTLGRQQRRIGSTLAVLTLTLLAALVAVHAVVAQQPLTEHWVGTWGTAVVGRPQNPPPPAAPAAQQAAQGQQPAQPQQPAPFVHVNNQTLRQIVHTSIGGPLVRLVVSNAFGTAPLVIGAAHLGLRAKDSMTVAAADRTLTFGGHASTRIPAGGVAFSDPVTLAVPPLTDLAIDLYLPGDTNSPSPLTIHNGALQTNYLSEPGNHVGKTTFPVAKTIQNWFLLARVEVTAPPRWEPS